MSERYVYLDHNATTPLHPEVKKIMAEAMDIFGNPSSLHGYGRQARELVESSREKVASFIGAHPDEVVFAGSGSEANNAVLSIYSCASAHCTLHQQMQNRLVTTKIEHPCILEASKCLQDRGVGVHFLDVDGNGKVDLGQLEEVMGGGVGLVSVMMANNEIGTIQDIGKIAEIVRSYGALFHTDAVQAVGKVPVNVQELEVDFLTISGHKIYGPKGVAALFVRRGVPFCPFIRGGHQERGRRAGTENTLGIVGLGKAIEMRAAEMEEEGKRLMVLRTMVKEGIQGKIPDIRFNGHPTDCLPGTVNVSFYGAEGEAILLYLDMEGIAVSTGSACASGSLGPSHVLLALGLEHEYAHGSIRMSMGRETTKEDIEYVLGTLPGVIEKIRNMSTVYSGRKAC